MLKSLLIQNFESHKDTEVTFAEGVTVVTGASDAGKSSLRRAIEFVVLNRPSGSGMVRDGEKATTVTLDGVVKHRSRSDHYYELDGVQYKALGRSVPDSVQQKFNMTALNFQQQHDVYFLIGNTPGERARLMNDLFDLGDVNKVLRLAKKKVSEARAELKVVSSMRSDAAANVKKLAWAEEAGELCDEIDLCARAIADASDEVTVLEQLLAQVRDAEHTIPDPSEDTGKLNVSYPDVVTLEQLLSQVRNAKHAIPDPSEDIGKLNISYPEVTVLEQLLSKVRDAEHAIPDPSEDTGKLNISYPDVVTLEKLLSQVRDAEHAIPDPSEDTGKLNISYPDVVALEKLLSKTRTTEADYTEMKTRFSETKKLFDDKLKKSGRCPLCSSLL